MGVTGVEIMVLLALTVLSSPPTDSIVGCWDIYESSCLFIIPIEVVLWGWVFSWGGGWKRTFFCLCGIFLVMAFLLKVLLPIDMTKSVIP